MRKPKLDYDNPDYYGEWEALVSLAKDITQDTGECPAHLKGFLDGGEPRDVEGYVRDGIHYWRAV